jgi:hypothetical protein
MEVAVSMNFHLTECVGALGQYKALFKAGLVLAICSGLTIAWQGQVNGFAAGPTAEEIDISRVFPNLRAGPYQDNLIIQVVEDSI